MSHHSHARAAIVSACAAPFAFVLLIAMIVGGTASDSAADNACASSSAISDGTTPAAGLTAPQRANARVIVATGINLGVPQPGETIALATALQESGLNNLPGGNADSLGLFQQRPSQGWGTPTQILNPTYAATQFYRHLRAVPGWQTMPLFQAAQAVQRSANPDAYARWQPLATQLAAQLIAAPPNPPGASPTASPEPVAAACPNDVDGPTSVTGYTIPPNTPPQIVTVIRFALAQLGAPYQWGGSGPNTWDCSGLTQAAYAKIGIPLGRTTYIQATQGIAVPNITDLRPGDLILIPGTDGTMTRPGHVGLYLGNGTLIQAPHTGDVVKLTPLTQWTNQIATIRRLTS